MGCLISACSKNQDEAFPYSKSYLIIPTEMRDGQSRSVYFEVNDDKFYFIKNEVNIDKAIEHFDEVFIMSEEEAEKLDGVLNDLRFLRKKFSKAKTVSPSKNMFELSIENLPEKEEARKNCSLTIDISESQKLEIPEKMTVSSPQHKLLRGIRHGKILVEIQNAHFLHPKIIKKHQLKNPYLILNIYLDEKRKFQRGAENNGPVKVASFTTSKSHNSTKPEWDEFFQHDFELEDRPICDYKIGMSFFYESEDPKNPIYQVRDEQMFSVTSLFDQKMQTKRIDFKDNFLKGVIAKLNVRLQFIYDMEGLKEKIQAEIKTKMQKLYNIREKHPIFEYGPKRNGSLMQSVERVMTDISSNSLSSNHDDQDIQYFVESA